MSPTLEELDLEQKQLDERIRIVLGEIGKDMAKFHERIEVLEKGLPDLLKMTESLNSSQDQTLVEIRNLKGMLIKLLFSKGGDS